MPTRSPTIPVAKLDKPEVKVVYTWKYRKPKVNAPVSKSKINVSVLLT